MTYRPHGHEPSDTEIAGLGYKAFGPTRPPFTPSAADFVRAQRDLATGDPDELAEVAEVISEWWPRGWFPYHFGYGYNWVDDD